MPTQNPFAEGGLFQDPQQMQALGGNPMFNMGMQLLASGYDARINPFQAALTGLQEAGKEGRSKEDRARDDELRAQLVEYFKQLYGDPEASQMPRAAGIAPPGVPGQQGPPG